MFVCLFWSMFVFFYRYDSPVNASPSRIADHLNPWEDDVEGIRSRRSFFSATPFLPSTPGLVGGRISTTSPKGRKSSTLPSRNSPAHPGGGPLTYSTDFSTDISDGEGGKDSTGNNQIKYLSGVSWLFDVNWSLKSR